MRPRGTPSWNENSNRGGLYDSVVTFDNIELSATRGAAPVSHRSSADLYSGRVDENGRLAAKCCRSWLRLKLASGDHKTVCGAASVNRLASALARLLVRA